MADLSSPKIPSSFNIPSERFSKKDSHTRIKQKINKLFNDPNLNTVRVEEDDLLALLEEITIIYFKYVQKIMKNHDVALTQTIPLDEFLYVSDILLFVIGKKQLATLPLIQINQMQCANQLLTKLSSQKLQFTSEEQDAIQRFAAAVDVCADICEYLERCNQEGNEQAIRLMIAMVFQTLRNHDKISVVDPKIEGMKNSVAVALIANYPELPIDIQAEETEQFERVLQSKLLQAAREVCNEFALNPQSIPGQIENKENHLKVLQAAYFAGKCAGVPNFTEADTIIAPEIYNLCEGMSQFNMPAKPEAGEEASKKFQQLVGMKDAIQKFRDLAYISWCFSELTDAFMKLTIIKEAAKHAK